MSDELNEKLDSAIGKLADQAKANPNSLHCVQYAQAAMYLANTKTAVTTGVVPRKLKTTE